MSNPETTETASDHCVSASAHVVGVLAEALAQHDGGFLRKDGDWQCRCGAVETVSTYPGALARHVASVVAALPNIAIVPTTSVEYAHIPRLLAAVRERDNTIARVREVIDYYEGSGIRPWNALRAALDPQETPDGRM